MSNAVPSQSVDLVVVGCGAAGLATAVSCLQAAPGSRVVVLERSREQDRGGNTAWTGSFFRLDADGTPSADFVDRMHELSYGKSDPEQIRVLAENAKPTIGWLTELGVEFETRMTYFLTAKGPRLMPAGGGAALVRQLCRAVVELGGEIRYESTAVALLGDRQRARGVVVDGPDGRYELAAESVTLACGGFEGSADMLVKHLGVNGDALKPIAPGGGNNRGEGIEMAVRLGADVAGQFERFHGEPVDPRSRSAEALVMAYPQGILVNGEGQRFYDEGVDTPDNTFEDLGYKIWADQQQCVHLITDQKINEIDGLERTMLTDRGPIRADSIESLATRIDVDAATLERTITEYNAAVRPGDFDPTTMDGKRTEGITPPKSNWARTIDSPPYLAWPITCAITFTFGGIRADERGRVLRPDGAAIDGLHAAGEIVGLYYHRYPGATSVLRALTFGKLIGAEVAAAVVARAGGAR